MPRVGQAQVAKVQHQDMVCTLAKGCNRNIENGNLSPSDRQWGTATYSRNRTKDWRQRSVSAEGECEIWDVLCPGFAPEPLLGLFWFWGLFSSWPCWRRSLCLCCSVRNACITSDAGVRRDTSPRFRNYHHYCLSLPRFLDWGRFARGTPLMQCAAGPSQPPPTSVQQVRKPDPEWRRWGWQPYCHTNVLDGGRPNQVLLLRTSLLETSSQLLSFYLWCPIPLR